MPEVRGGMGSPDGGPSEENLGAWYGLFTPTQVEAETARVSVGTTALYLRLRHMLATNVPVADVVHELHQRARCLLKADLNGDKIENADDVASDDASAVVAFQLSGSNQYSFSRDCVVQLDQEFACRFNGPNRNKNTWSMSGRLPQINVANGWVSFSKTYTLW